MRWRRSGDFQSRIENVYLGGTETLRYGSADLSAGARDAIGWLFYGLRNDRCAGLRTIDVDGRCRH